MDGVVSFCFFVQEHHKQDHHDPDNKDIPVIGHIFPEHRSKILSNKYGFDDIESGSPEYVPEIYNIHAVQKYRDAIGDIKYYFKGFLVCFIASKIKWDGLKKYVKNINHDDGRNIEL